MSEETNCEQCLATGFEHPCECCEHCKAHGCWLGAIDCTCGNEIDLQITALMEEVMQWRKLWDHLCGRVYSQQEDDGPDFGFFVNGRWENEGQWNVHRLNEIRDRHQMPRSLTWKLCLHCDEHGEIYSPCMDTKWEDVHVTEYECLVCGSPVED